MRLSTVAVFAKADTRRTAHGTKTLRLPSKGTPNNEDQEVTQDQRILKNPVNESEMRPYFAQVHIYT